MKILAILQARMQSTRLPGKVLKFIGKDTVINFMLNRLKRSKLIDDIIVAIPNDKKNIILEKYLKKKKFKVFKGSNENCLDRYYKAAIKANHDAIIYITADCPFMDPQIIDKMITIFKNKNLDYITNVHPPTFPDGMDVEILKFDLLKKVKRKATSKFDKEMVTSYVQKIKNLKKYNYKNFKNLSHIRLTLDQSEDLVLLEKIFLELNRNNFNLKDIMNIINKNPDLLKINSHIKRNEGGYLIKGQKFWRRANNVISGGNMLLTKNPDFTLPGRWPAYFTKAKGCQLWDLNGKKFLDFYLMGVGTNILGYNNQEVNKEVKKAIDNGNISTLNSYEEIYLAEKLLDMHPWFDKCKFARTGGEANSIAIRIARAATGKSKIAICGYHGWHDWYLSANIKNNKNLNTHLLENLKVQGVPKELKETVYQFTPDSITDLKTIIKNNDIGVVKMEVMRNYEPKPGFLKQVRDITRKNGIILIFDECTSGFRRTFGGLHKYYNVKPDMAVFGKALGNGYPITAVLGTNNVMKHVQNTFISSTFWTERVGPVAALKTLSIMEKKRSWIIIDKIGLQIRKKLKILAKKHNLNINFFGLPALTTFNLKGFDEKFVKTFLSQEFLKQGILGSNTIYVSLAHTKKMLNRYYKVVDIIFKKLSKFKNNSDLLKNIETDLCLDNLPRLN